MNTKRLAVMLAVALACCATQGQAAPPTVTASSLAPLPLQVALKAAKAAMAACVAQGLMVTVTVTDREGVARVVLLSDDTGKLSVFTSRKKAYTAAALGITTAQLIKNLAATGINSQTVDPEIVALAGGVPIFRHGIVVGALGVGGADRGDADEVCAQAGVDAIKNDFN